MFMGAALFAFAVEIFSDHEHSPQTLRVSQKSDINTLQAVFDTHFNVPKGEPEVVWRDKSGQTYGEAFIFDSMGVKKAQQARVRKELEAQGYERVYEECRGITKPDKSWSFGYCTYRAAPVLPEN